MFSLGQVTLQFRVPSVYSFKRKTKPSKRHEEWKIRESPNRGTVGSELVI
ncbi:hypothetical protein M7I_0366 [Glarea lozoyensis 74030]|uniref:Uncharacterized protein n=1 Tax=Glarea lozoyensis (strain ATCC 74030 / MF5533) TaxID=1104152 RepID=H0ED65_GLAL7|nr:hypothetical protein M7I_0366 [Glarea lozoyensis 74030]